MSRKKNPRSRWLRGADRYDEKMTEYILRRYREPLGWYQGARVRRQR